MAALLRARRSQFATTNDGDRGAGCPVESHECHLQVVVGGGSLAGIICDLIVGEASVVPVRVHGPSMKPSRSRLRAQRHHVKALPTMKAGEMPWARSMPNPPREPGRILTLPDLLVSKGVFPARNAVVLGPGRIRKGEAACKSFSVCMRQLSPDSAFEPPRSPRPQRRASSHQGGKRNSDPEVPRQFRASSPFDRDCGDLLGALGAMAVTVRSET